MLVWLAMNHSLSPTDHLHPVASAVLRQQSLAATLTAPARLPTTVLPNSLPTSTVLTLWTFSRRPAPTPLAPRPDHPDQTTKTTGLSINSCTYRSLNGGIVVMVTIMCCVLYLCCRAIIKHSLTVDIVLVLVHNYML